MNRWDEIQATARNIASNVHDDPALRDAMADDLIKLCGLMVGAVGKIVAGAGERAMNDAHDGDFELDTESISYSDAEVAERKAEFEAEQQREVTQAGAIYLTGERVQESAAEAVTAASNRTVDASGLGQGVDLERWRRTDPGTPCRCAHVPKAHAEDGTCNGEQFNGEPCNGGPCNGYVPAEPTGGWVHQDRRPAALRSLQPSDTRCNECNRIERFGHMFRCSSRTPATPVAVTLPPRPCCYAATGSCATCRNSGPVGRCCFPLRDVCPAHH